MKILNVVAEGRFGGPPRRVLEVGKRLRKKGIETIVVMPNKDSGQFQELLKENDMPFEAIRLHRITKDWKHLFGYFLFFIPELFHLIRLIKKHQIDIVHCNGVWQVKGLMAAKLTGRRSVMHLNDAFMPGYILFMFRIVSKLFSDTYIASSICSREFYTARAVSPKHRMDIVLPPVDTDKFKRSNVAAVAEIEAKEGLNIITVGNVNPIKGYPTFVKMVARVNELTDKKLNFYVVGKILDNQKKLNAELKEMVQELKIDNLEFLGGRGDIPQILKSADIFVCPSTSEAGPMSVFEAMSMECPVVSTDVGDVSSIFGGEGMGIIVAIDDAEAMAQGVLRLVEDEGLRKKMGEKAREKALETLDVSCCVASHETVYNDVKNGEYA